MGCKNCGEEYEDYGWQGGFCSLSCREEFIDSWADFRLENYKERRLEQDND